MWAIARSRRQGLSQAVSKLSRGQTVTCGADSFFATEWVSRKSNLASRDSKVTREVKIRMDKHRLKLHVSNRRNDNQVFRMLDLRRAAGAGGQKIISCFRSEDQGHRLLSISVPVEVDLILHFQSQEERDSNFDKLHAFFQDLGWTLNEAARRNEAIIWREAQTIDERSKVLASFFKSVLRDPDFRASSRDIDETDHSTLLSHNLTRTEFADALGLQPNSLFVRNMFLLVDTSGDGLVSFGEFTKYFGILSAGSSDDKAEMFFKIFDTKRKGTMTKHEYKKMILSLMDLQDKDDRAEVDVNKMVDKVFADLGKDHITAQDLKTIMFSGNDDVWKSVQFDLDVPDDSGGKKGAQGLAARRGTARNRAQTVVARYRKSMRHPSARMSQGSVKLKTEKPKEEPKSGFAKQYQVFCNYVDNHNSQIFWLTLYVLVTCGIFIERAHYYSIQRETGGLRRLASWGVSITRGAASAQMFTYASLLVTMSRNTLTALRNTFLHRFVPFDSMHDMHICIAGMAMFFTLVHVVGHLFNLYHICTQASTDLNCYFREYFRPTHVLANFHYWAYETMTGFTGILLVFVLLIMYVFASSYARRYVFKSFRITHNLYIVVYILMFLHGAARMVQVALWPYFFLGPMTLFLLDKLYSVSRNSRDIGVLKAEHLPSDVISLVFQRPPNFNYQSGQWVRIASAALGTSEYHPFTLTSAPHENHLSLHIRALGPWTTNLKEAYDPTKVSREQYPRIYLDGPFGEGHQDWYRYKVAVLIGSGIGVTPFASILKDIAQRSNELNRFQCNKVYFFWVTRNQKSFEWMTDIIRQVEKADLGGFVETHIFITQLKNKFDLRTTMLYFCERHFQKVAEVSMFTGLRAKTHFGRPKFNDTFRQLKAVHNDVDQIGVFTCGGPAVARSVQQACIEQNAESGPAYVHHFENF